ncbi:hypothetical protein ASPVEDRAFT_22810 [Aspergillus versicolor CBS 583.65]|uniref:Uncharacterized protein n=1 Tax=Aspergillus versicolor CBS 583.65 TaxID=1036611 RepID=A0A1L9P2P4_ASPVE|nr:uncharacterized protein ASPVEDRAFT_22810 [Aspergillus versicolor CBS 583.65]OJI95771.1 hypothetical protein ASPVEDRAFT_22810 [Aspergillus versicolor CBS 583.65]
MRLSVLALAAVTQTALGCTFGIALTHSTAHGSDEVECYAQIWESDDVDFWNDGPASYTNTECQAGCYDVEHKGNTYQFCLDSVANNRLHGDATVQLTSNGGGDLLHIKPDGEEYHQVANVFLGQTDYRAYYLAGTSCPDGSA